MIFTSDNGAHWLPEDIDEWHHRANANWRGQKADIWDGGHRVPFIVRWPGVVTAGSQSEQLVCLTDVLATVADVVGQSLAAEAGEDSFSFLPDAARLQLEDGRPARRSCTIPPTARSPSVRALGSWRLKLGSHGFSEPKNVEPTPGGPQGQLYNLAEDPGETRNRWLDEPATVERLTRLLTAYQQQGRSRPPTP